MAPLENKNLLKKIQEELSHARDARATGNEGMARVCARRAAGVAVGIYLSNIGYTGIGVNVYERLNIFISLPNVSTEAIEAAEHLIIRVNQEHELPIEIDLIEDATWLIKYLLSDIHII